MAKTPAKKSPPPDRLIQVSVNDYLNRQNEIATSIRAYHQMATNMLQFVSQQVGTASQAMQLLQQSTHTNLEANNIDPMEDALAAFPAIAALLKMDKTELGNPFAAGLGNMPAVDLSSIGMKIKKPKKPRKAKDPNAPTRPQTAFFLFQSANREKFRERMKAQNPDVKPGDVQKRLTDTWNQMSAQDQKPYKDQYQSENELYNIKKKDYEKNSGKPLEEASDDEAIATKAFASAIPPVHTVIGDAIGDAESDDDDEDDSSSEGTESESERSPTPPPKKKSKKHRERTSKELSPEKKKKRKQERDEDSDEETAKKRKKSKESGTEERKKKKNRQEERNIDPELKILDKEQRKQKRKSQQYGEDY